MRRDRPHPSPAEALQACEAMLRDDLGLRLFLPLLPPGSTVEDARRFRERQKQVGRRPSACMRALLEIP
jgi:hypothetical protein